MESHRQHTNRHTQPRQSLSRLAAGLRARVFAVLKRASGIEGAIVAVSLALVAAIWGAAVSQTDRERQNAIEEAYRQNSNLAIAFEEHTVRTVRGVDEAVLLIAHEYARDGNAVDIAKLVEHGLIDGRLFTNLAVVDEHGDLVLSGQKSLRFNIADREYFQAHRDSTDLGLKIGTPISSRSQGNLVIPMSRRINKPDGSFGG